mgnify:CR=1 FL=1
MKFFGCVLTIAVALSACSTMDAQREPAPMFQSAVYIVGDNAAVEAMPQADVMNDMNDMKAGTDASAIKRLYWFFSGR